MRVGSHMASHYTWGSVTTQHDFWRCVGMAFRHFLLDFDNFMVAALGSCVKWSSGSLLHIDHEPRPFIFWGSLNIIQRLYQNCKTMALKFSATWIMLSDCAIFYLLLEIIGSWGPHHGNIGFFRSQWQFNSLPQPLILHLTHMFLMGLKQYLVDQENILYLVPCRTPYRFFIQSIVFGMSGLEGLV